MRIEVARALARARDGRELTVAEALPLTTATGAELRALVGTADLLRERQVGDTVTYVVNRNVNFTNVCIKHCGFCAFSRDHRVEQGYRLPDEEILRRIQEAVDLGATEVCVQAGLMPKMEGWLYVDLTRKIKERFPTLHLHAFSPEEVLYGSIRARTTIRDYLTRLKEAGLDSLPGTSAEILDQGLRDRIAPGRISVAQWKEVIRTAHELGLPTTSTMMFGHAEEPRHWLEHMQQLREIQHDTGGFTEFVPLGFVHQEAPTKLGEPTGLDVLRVHALARVFLGGSIPNLQASWVKEGPKLAQILLDAGVNDLGGTLMNESISTAAGASHGQLMTPEQLERLIVQSGRIPQQRTMRYERAVASTQLNGREDGQFGSYRELTLSSDHRYRLAR